jgi:hypothetical protein
MNVKKFTASLLLILIVAGCATQPGKVATLNCNGLKTSKWTAWDNLMPGSDKSLHVKGTGEFHSLGWKTQLEEAVPQGINPKILLLKLIVTPPGGPSGDQDYQEDIKFSKAQAAGKYEEVTVLCEGGKSITIPVSTATH